MRIYPGRGALHGTGRACSIVEIPDLIRDLPGERLLHVGIAGPPGAGKSTLAAWLARTLNGGASAGPAVLVEMDGFHLDNRVLAARGLLARRGAPETFDALGFVAVMERLHRAEEVAIPVFDRARDIAIAGAAIVTPAHRYRIVEGNYLLLDFEPWSRLAELFDLTIAIEVDEGELELRLVARWLAHGLEPAAARERARTNDMPNARLVAHRSRPADLVVRPETLPGSA